MNPNVKFNNSSKYMEPYKRDYGHPRRRWCNDSWSLRSDWRKNMWLRYLAEPKWSRSWTFDHRFFNVLRIPKSFGSSSASIYRSLTNASTETRDSVPLAKCQTCTWKNNCLEIDRIWLILGLNPCHQIHVYRNLPNWFLFVIPSYRKRPHFLGLVGIPSRLCRCLDLSSRYDN